MDTNTVILSSVIVLAGTTLVAQIKHNNLQFSSIIAAGFVGVFLGLIAMVSEQVARAFAILILVVAILRNGQATFGTFGGKTK